VLNPPNGLLSGLTCAGPGQLGRQYQHPQHPAHEDRYQYADNLSWTKGTHQFKFGIDFALLRDTENALFNGPGSYTYGSNQRLCNWTIQAPPTASTGSATHSRSGLCHARFGQ